MIDKILTIPSIIKRIDQQLVNQYAIAANDLNPIHTDPNIAQHTIFKKPVAHGMLIASAISEAMTLVYGDDWFQYGSMEIKWKAPAITPIEIYTEITFSKEDEELIIYNAKCFNEHDAMLIIGKVSLRRN
jgi:acyl dehydratase